MKFSLDECEFLSFVYHIFNGLYINKFINYNLKKCVLMRSLLSMYIYISHWHLLKTV